MKRIAIAAAAAVVVAGCYPVVPPGAVQATGAASLPSFPNWQIKVSKLDDTHYRIDLGMRPVTTGGVGEAEDLFHRQAEAIATRTKSPGYLVLSWNEGIESQFPLAWRWARGVIQVQPVAAASNEP